MTQIKRNLTTPRVLLDTAAMLAFAVLLALFISFGLGGISGSVELGGANQGNGVEHGANPGQGGTSANPNGQADGGNGIHNIQGIQARQGRDGGTPPACTAHGGAKFQARNQNCGG